MQKENFKTSFKTSFKKTFKTSFKTALKSQSFWINGLFLVLIFGITLLSIFFPKKAYSATENRMLAQMPAFSVKALIDGSYVTGYENYVTDQFPYRDDFITAKTYVELALQKKEINDVYFAADDYLIEKHTAAEIEGDQLTANVNSIVKFTAKAEDLVGEDNVKLMLVPTADVILADKLPAYAEDYDQEALLQQIDEQLIANGSTDALLDVSNILKEHAEDGVFYRTDHHWTTLGAYYAYTQWAESMGIEPLALEDYQVETVCDSFYGTITSKLNLETKADQIQLFYPKEEQTIQIRYNQAGEWDDSLYDMEALQTTDEYEVFQGGNYGMLEIRTNVENGKKLLVVKDSYANSFLPFLTAHYEEIQVLDLRFFSMAVATYMQTQSFDSVLVLYNIPNFATEKTVYFLK